MEEESVLAPEAGPEAVATEQVVAETPQTPEQEGEQGDEKSERARQRREREKATKERLYRERDEAVAALNAIKEREDRLKRAIEADTPPKEADFPDPVQFAAATGGWHAKRGLKEDSLRETEFDREKVSQKLQRIAADEDAMIAETWSEQVKDAKERYADFEAVALNPKLPMPPVVARMVATSEMGADLAYHLGKNPGLAAEIALAAQSNPVEAARKLGRIEATLTAPKPRTETNAPPPITPVRGPARASLNADTLSMEEYIAARKSGKLR